MHFTLPAGRPGIALFQQVPTASGWASMSSIRPSSGWPGWHITEHAIAHIQHQRAFIGRHNAFGPFDVQTAEPVAQRQRAENIWSPQQPAQRSNSPGPDSASDERFHQRPVVTPAAGILYGYGRGHPGAAPTVADRPATTAIPGFNCPCVTQAEPLFGGCAPVSNCSNAARSGFATQVGFVGHQHIGQLNLIGVDIIIRCNAD